MINLKIVDRIWTWWQRIKEWFRLWPRLQVEKRENLALRADIAGLVRDIKARDMAIDTLQAKLHDPMAESRRLLRIADDLLSSRGAINAYELRCWRDEYRQSVMRRSEMRGQ